MKLLSTLDRATGAVLKSNPRYIPFYDMLPAFFIHEIHRVLTKGTSAEVQIVLRSTVVSGISSTSRIPLETFAANKDMGRVLLRRGGETIAAGESCLVVKIRFPTIYRYSAGYQWTILGYR